MFRNYFQFIKITKDQKYDIAQVCTANYEADIQTQAYSDSIPYNEDSKSKFLPLMTSMREA